MPGPGFKSLSPEVHRAISSKGGKMTVARWRQKLKVYSIQTPEQRQQNGRNRGITRAAFYRIHQLELRLKEIENDRTRTRP